MPRSRSHSPRPSTSSQRQSYRQRDHRGSEPTKNRPPVNLPFAASPLPKHGLSTYRLLLGLYLDVQKQLDIEDLGPEEVKGRWKSFLKKWNNGDLAEGWYDPSTFEKARTGTFGVRPDEPPNRKSTPSSPRRRGTNVNRVSDNDDGGGGGEEDDQDYGPEPPTSLLPTSSDHSSKRNHDRAGPSIPTTSDLALHREQEREDQLTSKAQYIESIRAERKADRKLQKDRLDEIAPRAESGTRERQLEKKREVANSNRAFAASKEAGGDIEMRDSEVMGEGDSLGELKRMKEQEQRKKNDRELKREEILRARAAEREERLKGMREKEAKTMEMLKSIAKARFG